jgi:hypothetical protein
MDAATKKVGSKSIVPNNMPTESAVKNVEIRRNYASNPGQTLKILSAVVTGMNENPNFPDMTPKYEELVLAKATLSNALDESKRNRSALARQATSIAQTNAIGLLDTCAAFVAQKSGADEIMALTSGFTLKKTTRVNVTPPPAQAKITGIVKSAYPNQVEVKVTSLGIGVTYLLLQSSDNQETWTIKGAFTNTKKIVAKDLVAKEEYWFQVIGQTSGGNGPASESKNWVGQTS